MSYRAALLEGTQIRRVGHLYSNAADAILDAMHSWIEHAEALRTAERIKYALDLEVPA